MRAKKPALGGLSVRRAVCTRSVCIIHTMNSADLIKQLERDGWELVNVRGSHHVFRHPAKPGHISVPHPRKDLGKGLAHKLLKLAGLK